MRVTTGKFLRRFVYCWKHGHRDVVRVMRGGLEIWPGDEERIRRIAVDMSGIDGTELEDYWKHALAYAERNTVQNRISVTIAGREYCFGRSVNRKPVVTYSQGWLDFGDNGPALRDVRVGDVLVVRANVPKRNGDVMKVSGNGALTLETGWPWMPDIYLHITVSKGKKKVCAGCRFKLTGMPSGRGHLVGFIQKNGHCRGDYSADVYARTGWIIDGWMQGWYNGKMDGDTNLQVSLESYNDTEVNSYLVLPAFRQDFKLKVLAIETV